MIKCQQDTTLACGGVLQVSAIMSYVALLLVFKSYIRHRRLLSKELIYFIATFLGSSINAFAPGNFIRTGEDSGLGLYTIVRASFNACYVTIIEFKHILLETYFPFYAVLFFISLYFFVGVEENRKKITFRPLLVVVHTVLVSVIATFPVVLGHDSTYMENRNITILDFEIIFGLLLAIYAFYNTLDLSLCSTMRSNMSTIFIVVILGMICYNQNYEFTEQPTINVMHQLVNGKVQQYSNDMDVVINYLENSTGDVAVPPVHCEQGVIYRLDFGESSDYWVNKGAAEYFELNSIYLDVDLEVNDLREMGY